MVRPDFAKWDQASADMYRLSVEAKHPRSRERYQALFLIGTYQTNATQWAKQIGRKNQTVMDWVHQYNESGPVSLEYHRTGGSPPFLPRQSGKGSSEQS